MLQQDFTSGKYYFYGTEITAERYAEIRGILDEMPEAPAGYFYVLTEELEWDLREDPDPEEDEPEPEELLSILLGGAT